jgi:phosphohistidine phosphatase
VTEVFIVRHAEAGAGHPDELRRLTESGREQARALGERLAQEATPDAVVSSPLLRARETAELIARPAGLTAEVDESLAPGADAEALRSAVAGRGSRVVVVGHQPDCGRIAAELQGGPEPPFPPAGTFVVDIDVDT